MRRSSLTTALEVCAAASIATSIPLLASHTSLEIRQDTSAAVGHNINCTDLSAIYDTSCWGELDLSNWMYNEKTGWNQTVPLCGVRGNTMDSSKCCVVYPKPEPWSTCFLRLATQIPGFDCSKISWGTCSLDVPVKADVSIAPQIHYVVKNIVTINNFFTTYWTALKYAASQAALSITPLVNRLDPLKQHGWVWQNLLTMLGFGLAFLGIPAVGVWILERTATSTKTFASITAISFMQAPATARAMWPIGTDNSRLVQTAQLQQALSDASDTLGSMIDNANSLLMNDMVTFINYVKGGQYSGPSDFSLPDKTDGLDWALKAYMTSVALSKNSWAAKPSAIYYDTFEDACQSGYMDGDYICGYETGGAFFWSPDTGRTYGLMKYNDRDADTQTRELLHEIVDKGWAPLNILFDGAYNCTKEGRASPDSLSWVNFNWDGTLDIACISQLPIRIGCNAPCEPGTNGTCPFHRDDSCNGGSIL